jgi:hypothetical protein
MANKKSNKKSPLDGFKLYAEDAHPKKYLSPTAGKGKPFQLLRNAGMFVLVIIVSFFIDVFSAIKTIYKEIE